jgi:hypothetical protein
LQVYGSQRETILDDFNVTPHQRVPGHIRILLAVGQHDRPSFTRSLPAKMLLLTNTSPKFDRLRSLMPL